MSKVKTEHLIDSQMDIVVSGAFWGGKTQLKRRLIDPINGMVSGRGFVVVYTTSRVAGKEIIQWRTLQEQTYTRK